MKKIFQLKWVPIYSIILSAAVGVWAYPFMPDKMASHWNAAGQVNGYMGKFWGIFFLPVIFAFMALLFYVIPLIDPKKENIEKFRAHFNRFIAVIFLFMFYIQGLALAWNFGYRFNFSKAIIPALAVLLYAIGNLVKHAEPNWSIGIRTPWTMSSENVWIKTHQLASVLYKLCGFLILASLAFGAYVFWISIGAILTSSLFLVGYSYALYRKEKQVVSCKL